MDKVFEEALGVEDPWFVRQITFNKEPNRLDVDIDFKKGSRFPIEDGGKSFKNQ
jgi:transposase